MRSRNRLHVDKLGDFAEFCAGRGWSPVSVVGEFEALRMVRDGRVMIVHKRLSTNAGNALVHLTTWGESEKMLALYMERKRERH